MKWIEAKGMAALRREGRGPTLLLVHGCGCDHRVWLPLIAALPEVDVVAPDLPGRNRSPGAPPTTATEAAQALDDFLRAQHMDSPVVLGHSYGGAIAIELALLRQAAERPLAGLILAATGARLRVSPMILELMRVAADAGGPAPPLSLWSPHADPALVAAVDGAPVPALTALADWQSANRFDRMADVATIRTPTLVLGGAADTLTPPKFSRFLADAIPGARLELVEGEGHLLPVEAAARVAPYVRALLDSRA